MPRLLKTSVSAALLTLATLASQAQTPPAPGASTPGVDVRQAHQQARIAQGAASGALTPHEQRRLQREQRAVAHAEAHAKADGTVTAKERHRLHKMQDGASADIRHQKHDRQHRKPAPAASAPN